MFELVPLTTLFIGCTIFKCYTYQNKMMVLCKTLLSNGKSGEREARQRAELWMANSKVQHYPQHNCLILMSLGRIIILAE